MNRPSFIQIQTVCSRILLLLFLVTALPRAVADTIPLLAQQTALRTVILSWSGTSGTVSILRQYPDDLQPIMLATTTLNSWTDVQSRTLCGDTVRYTVCGASDTGFAAVYVADNEPTSPAQWGVVTMDHTTHQIVLQWQPSNDTDIMGYLVCEGTPSMAIDTVFGRFNTLYAYPTEDSIRVHQFRICAFDSCRQASALTEQCNNIVLLLENELCSQTITASWNSYINMPSGVGSYEIWTSENNEPYQRRSVLPADGSTTSSFNVAVGCTVLRAYIRAVSTDGSQTALSNLVTIDFDAAERPQYIYLRRVSIDDDNPCVQILGATQPRWDNAEFKVYRHTGNATPSLVGVCQPSPQGELRWQDCQAHYDETAYSYLLAVTDACGRNEMRSDEAQTILPTVSGDRGPLVLSWNHYLGWTGNTTYRVYVSSPDQPQWQLTASTSDNSVTLADNQPVGLRSYKVVACEGPDSRYQHGDTVQSAIVSYTPPADIWMPNAFTPLENSNNTYGPKSVFINPEGYSFAIFNRHGILLFSTSDPSLHWDGRYKGQIQPAGSYVYTLSYRQSNGADCQRTGSFLLIL